MSQFRPWAFWRRVQYGAGFLSVWVLIFGGVYFSFFYAAPTCFDGLQNGAEEGVDCNGGCTRICAVTVMQPEVMWAKSFKITDGQYNAVAYVENKNTIAGTPEMQYTFKLFESGSLIGEKSGVTVLPPSSQAPIFAGRIETLSGRVPTETRLEISPVELWLPGRTTRNQFRVTDLNLEAIDTRPKLTAAIENTELTDAGTIEVVATLFDRAGSPVTASQTFIDNFSARSTREVVFTWPNSLARTVRSCDIPSDIVLVLDRSGSMAAGGGEPPEPLESAKRAAERFVAGVQNNNLLGVLSYATTPSQPLEQPLTADKQAVVAAISGVTMGTDGVQYTNMGDAFKVAQAELTSERHRSDARKVIIFMTDGDVTRPANPETNETDRAYAAAYAERMAAEAKAAETTIYTIGFGDFLNSENENRAEDRALIRSLASDPSLYFEAPTATDLEAVYKQITDGLCEEGPTRIEVIAKPITEFSPLQ